MLFVLSLGVLLTLVLTWSFRALPGERWQIAASVPTHKDDKGFWKGMNLTYYGVLNAFAYSLGVAIAMILMASVSISLEQEFLLTMLLLTICMPASRILARIVEKKRYTFTVGGAAFVGILLAPWLILLLNRFTAPGGQIPLMPALAAFTIAYAFGEGVGRLACISFGCCYGIPVSQCPPPMRTLFEHWNFVFQGKTKKIAYAHGMDGQEVVPVQAVTSILFVGCGLIGMMLFAHSRTTEAFILTSVVIQGWRVVSETLRADYRGEGSISAYQIMAIIGMVYVMTIPLLLPPSFSPAPDLTAGLAQLWNPGALIFLQGLWLASFLMTGRSMVTGSTISFHVHRERT